MNRIQTERGQIISQIFSAFPESLGFTCNQMSDTEYQLQSCSCIIRLCFERYEPRLSSTEFIDPADAEIGMTLWILLHILGVQIHVSDEKRPYYDFGKAIVDYCGDILNGDFSIRKEYDSLKDRIMDRMFEVRALPQDHPTRVRFENRDLQWLFDLEASDSTKG